MPMVVFPKELLTESEIIVSVQAMLKEHSEIGLNAHSVLYALAYFLYSERLDRKVYLEFLVGKVFAKFYLNSLSCRVLNFI